MKMTAESYLLELARATSLVSFGSIQTRPFPHFNTVAASLFWSLKNAINLYSFNYNNDKANIRVCINCFNFNIVKQINFACFQNYLTYSLNTTLQIQSIYHYLLCIPTPIFSKTPSNFVKISEPLETTPFLFLTFKSRNFQPKLFQNFDSNQLCLLNFNPDK